MKTEHLHKERMTNGQRGQNTKKYMTNSRSNEKTARGQIATGGKNLHRGGMNLLPHIYSPPLISVMKKNWLYRVANLIPRA